MDRSSKAEVAARQLTTLVGRDDEIAMLMMRRERAAAAPLFHGARFGYPRPASAVLAALLPHQPQESVIKSGDPGDAQNQSDSQGYLRTDAIKNPSEAEHDTGPCFSSWAQYRCGAHDLL
jgi:hypothetical protein